MVVCKFFQQGHCRFGQSCRFEHIYGSKYNYHASAPAPAPAAGITDEQLYQQVRADAQAAVRGGQWLLSVYAPFKEKPNFPGFTDLSFEEARLFVYEAKANNTLDQAIAYINKVTQEARSKYEQLLLANPTLTKALRSIYKGEAIASPFNQQANVSNAASSIFRSAVQPSSVFGQASQMQTNSFQPQNNAKSIFAQATQSTFGQAPQNANSIFASASQQFFGQPPAATGPFSGATNVFQKPEQQTQSAFGQSPFGQPPAPAFAPSAMAQNADSFFGRRPAENVFAQKPASIFQAAASPPSEQSVFGQPAFGQPRAGAPEPAAEQAVYSRPEDISEPDMRAFQAADFKLGFIPEVAPPKALCV